MSQTIDWPGQSGRTYRYWLNSMADGFMAVSGNYAFVKILPNGNAIPLYFGESDDLSRRLTQHEIWPQAVRLGATHVMSHTTPTGYLSRLDEERDLIARWNPVLNTQHRTTG
jgi:hypothetical protein